MVESYLIVPYALLFTENNLTNVMCTLQDRTEVSLKLYGNRHYDFMCKILSAFLVPYIFHYKTINYIANYCTTQI